jgi:hypothetical protein
MQNVKRVESVLLPAEHLIGNPYDMVVREDMLIYCDYHEGKFFSLYDLKENRLAGRHVSVGNGPDEVIPPLYILSLPQKDRLYAYQRNVATLNVFSVPGFRILNSIQFTSSTPWRPLELAKTKDYYIGETIYEDGRFGIYNQAGELLQTGGMYPFRGKDMDPMSAFILYQGACCASPENNCFAFGSTFCDHISFYEAGENGVTLLREYASSDAKVSYPGQLVVDDDCLVAYTCAYGTVSRCYMLYSGKTYAANGNQSDGGHYILVFDWQGNYVETLETDREIRRFCVDESHRVIYAIALDEEGEYGIVKFQL